MTNSSISYEPKPKWKQFLFGLVFSFIIIFLLGLYKFFEIKKAIAEGQKMGPPPEAVTTTILKKEVWHKEISTSGRIEPINGALIKAEVGGRVDKIHFTDGAKIKKGDLLIELDLEIEEAEYKSALAKSELAKKTLSRQEKLFASNAISQEEYDTAKLNSISLDSLAKSIKAKLDKKEIRAPFPGTIGVRRVNIGQYIDQGYPLFQLTDDTETYLTFSFGDNDSKLIAIGNKIKFYPAGTNQEIRGEVIAIDPSLSFDTGTRLVKAKLDQSLNNLIVGTYGKVNVTLNHSLNAYSIPTTSIKFAPYGNSIFLVKYKEDKDSFKSPYASPIFIKIADRKGDFVAITDGVNDGDEVVTNGVFKLQKETTLIINNSSPDKSSFSPTPNNS